METSLVLKMVGRLALLAFVILLLVPTSSDEKMYGESCGNVFDRSYARGCDKAINTRWVLSLVVGATGVVALWGASQVKKRE